MCSNNGAIKHSYYATFKFPIFITFISANIGPYKCSKFKLSYLFTFIEPLLYPNTNTNIAANEYSFYDTNYSAHSGANRGTELCSK